MPEENASNPSVSGVTTESASVKSCSLSGLTDWMVGGLFIVLISMVSYLLFFAAPDTPLFGNIPQSEQIVKEYDVLTVAYDQPLLTYESTVSDLVTRGYLANTYEGLVSFDANLSVEPALALSWGMLDQTTWQFKLRPEVKFHDGSSFEAEDVVVSFDRARSHPDSEIQNLVSSVDRVKVVDSLTIHVFTDYADPLLLNKLTALPIVPSELSTRVSTPVGTGPYVFNDEGENAWNFSRYNGYWGDRPAYPRLSLQFVPDKFDRYELFTEGSIDVMAQVAPVFIDPLLAQDYKIASQPSLEVNFLLFGGDEVNSSFRHRELRDALRYVFDPIQMSKLTGGFSRPIGQFVSRGIFGYNPDLDVFPYDVQKARSLVASVGPNLPVMVDLPLGLDSLGDYIEQQLKLIGLRPTVNYLEPDLYLERTLSGKSELFFYGWRSDLGDAGDFFAKLVHSATLDERYGTLNQGRYMNENLDQRIELMDRNLLETQRLESLQNLMDFVVNEDIIGVPLFETDVLIGIQPELEWNPRVDNFILAADFK
jgi:peptide/nickel transport system substrate-binding protein